MTDWCKSLTQIGEVYTDIEGTQNIIQYLRQTRAQNVMRALDDMLNMTIEIYGITLLEAIMVLSIIYAAFIISTFGYFTCFI